jgi:hypothetical protein
LAILLSRTAVFRFSIFPLFTRGTVTPTCSKQKKWPKVVFDALGDFVVVYTFRAFNQTISKCKEKKKYWAAGM